LCDPHIIGIIADPPCLNGERRTIPMNTTVLDILKGTFAARPGKIDLVFHSEIQTPLDGATSGGL